MTEEGPTYTYTTERDEELVAMSDLERAFQTFWHILTSPLGLPDPVPEYRFHATRDWRFDFAWPDQLVAVELDGGTWAQGRHTRGAGYRADCVKANTAQMAGWIVLHFTTDMLQEDPKQVIRQIGDAIMERMPV